MSRPLDGKVALVTGATSGIGRAAAVALSEAGAKVAMCGRRENEGKDTAKLVSDAGGEGLFVQADVSKSADVLRFINTVVERFGRIDCAVNNAGVGVAGSGRLANTTEEQYDYVFNTNVRGVYLCMKYELERLMAQKSPGSIINISSIQGHVAIPGSGHYTASKHAVEGYTKLAALDYASSGIRVNALALGGLDGMGGRGYPEAVKKYFIARQPLGRLVSVKDVGSALVFLASDASAFMTGTSLVVDGGYLCQ